jgi:hypothetical protein
MHGWKSSLVLLGSIAGMLAGFICMISVWRMKMI